MILDTTAPAEELQDKLSALEQLLLAYGRVAIGFSGGVDSSFLAAVCARIMPTNTLLIHLTTPLIGTPEQTSFEQSVDGQANEGPHFKLPVLNLSVDQLQLPQVACNDANRCYHCKHAGFTAIVNHAKSLGFPTVIDGSNASDRGDYRPRHACGRRARRTLPSHGGRLYQGRRARAAARHGAIPFGTCRREHVLPPASPRARSLRARRSI